MIANLTSVITKKHIEDLFELFIILLLFEGILRKWLLPENIGFVFMVIRDPIVALIVIKGYKYHIIHEPLIKVTVVLSILSFFTTLLFGHHNLVVALYGIRIYILYFPAIFIIGNVISIDCINKIGKLFIYIFPFVVFITILQFFLPPGNIVNAGKGFALDSTVSAGELQMKASGIFTNVVGLTDYYILVLAFILFFYMKKKDVNGLNMKYLFICVVLYIISIPVSVSRTHLFYTIISLFCYSLLVKKKQAFKMLFFLGVLAVLFVFLMKIPEFRKTILIFNDRFTGANQTEGGILSAIWGRTIGFALNVMDNNLPLFGYGEGYATNVGIKMIHGFVGVRNMSNEVIVKRLEDSEMEWARILTESGIILGSIFVFIRIKLSFMFLNKSLKNLLLNNNKMAWIFLPPAFLFMMFLQIKVPTNLGFMLLACALLVASLRIENNTNYENSYSKFRTGTFT